MIRFTHIGALFLLLAGGMWACTPDPLLPTPPDMTVVVDPEINPRTIFASQALPALATCETCHKLAQDSGTILPFLTPGNEYDAVTSYGQGKFLSANPNQSLLLTKGPHTGPALTADQTTHVLAWLTVEATARSMLGGSTTSVTPSVALRQGDFFMNLEKLVGDPLANITFHVDPGSNNNYHISKLMLNAGPGGGIHVIHPLFMLYTTVSAGPDPGNSLSTVDLSVDKSMSAPMVPGGAIILTSVPLGARAALAFQTIAPVNPVVGGVMCKALGLFKTNVLPLLHSPCSVTCHSPSGSDPRAPQATSAFDMTAAAATDDPTLASFCVRTLGRAEVQDPAQSVIVLQPEPLDLGGTTNHPFKWSSDATSKAFAASVATWLAGEK